MPVLGRAKNHRFRNGVAVTIRTAPAIESDVFDGRF
jgi:hypothetical protein